MALKNKASLTPLLLAIYNSHFFVVHYLLSIEQVIDSINTSAELYRLF